MTVMFMMKPRVATYTQNVVLKRKRTFATNVLQLVVVWGKKSLNFGVKTDFTNTRPKIN